MGHGAEKRRGAAQEERAGAPEPTTPKELERNQRLTIAEESLNAASTGLTANFITPFALALGSSSTLIAAITTLPSLIAAFAQLGVQRARSWFATRRRHMFVFSLLQAIMWLPLLAVPALAHPGLWLLGIVTLNTVFGFLVNPVLSGFTADIVPDEQRGRFFGLRNTLTGISTFLTTLLAGFVLALTTRSPLSGFAILFSLAFAARAASAYLFTRMGAPPEAPADGATPEPHELLMHANRTPLGKFTLFLTLFLIAVNIASPFFSVYELSVLGFSYAQYTAIMCMGLVTGFVTMSLWGRYVDRIGSRTVLVTCGLLTPVIPLVWAMTSDFRILLATEALSGIAWAGFNLSVTTYLIDATERRERTRQVAEYTVLVQIAVFAGAMAGGGLLGHYGKDAAQSFVNLFFLSAALRFIVVLAFYQTIKELRLVEVPVRGRLFRGFVLVRPHMGAMQSTAVESFPARAKAAPQARARDARGRGAR